MSVAASWEGGCGPWVDEIAIERAMAGDRVRLTPLERAEAVMRLTARGVSAREVGRRLGATQRTVVRHRARARTAGDWRRPRPA